MAVSKTHVLAFVIGLIGSNRHLKDRTWESVVYNELC